LPTIKINIEKFLALAESLPVFDVRSPGEFNHAHLPGAFSLPLFSNDQRAVVGTIYKQEGREPAIKKGLEYFGPKMTAIVEEVESIIAHLNTKKTREDPNQVLVHCWRGGMRSEAIAWLLDLYGFKVYTLAGGYKSYRRYVIETFSLPFQFKILGGYTGSGKTELLQSLQEKGERVVDLERIANHKGSAFGSIGLPPQPGQEMFENLLALELRKTVGQFPQNQPIWLEDESQRIGLVNIPPQLWKTMRNSPVYFLDIPFNIRLKHITREYGELDREKLKGAIQRISEKLGGLNAKTALDLMEQGNMEGCFDILLRYYDRFYFKALHNREAVQTLLNTIKCGSITPENANQLAKSYISEKSPVSPG
jgi:tRNA 2-selenouridine synthase